MSQPVRILYATMTGNAEYCAGLVEKAVRPLGFAPRVQNVCDFEPAELAHDRLALICASTYGEGDPPPDAESFYENLQSLAPGTLSDLRYALLAFGDTNYDDFCGFGKKFESELQRLGAQPFLPRAEADVDYDATVERWIGDLCAALAPQATPTAA